MADLQSNQALQLALKVAIDQLDDALDALASALRTETGYPAWGWKTEDPERARGEAIRMLLATDYHDDQAPNQSRYYPALIGTRSETLMLARQLNEAKAAVAEAFTAMRGRHVREDGKTKELTRHALERMGRARFHFHMATRQIVICDEKPSHVGFTWLSRSNRIQQSSREEVIERLYRTIEKQSVPTEDPGIEQDLERLRALAPGTPLAFKRAPIPHPRANIAWRHPDGTIVRKLRPAMLPILYPTRADEDLPSYRPLPPEPTMASRRRTPRPGERRVAPERLLRTLPVYRYQECR